MWVDAVVALDVLVDVVVGVVVYHLPDSGRAMIFGCHNC